jgi:UDP-2,3-diacylglucosamine hydrolase
MSAKQKVYFLSDFHLGVPDHAASLIREKRIVHFLRLAAKDAAEVHIVGDLFDMWFEYKEVVPRGFVRLLGALADLSDAGIPVHVHIGNHDMWMFGYLPQETGAVLHREPLLLERNGRKLLVGHGDGLGPGDRGYKFIKKVFRNPVMQWCFARLHPNFGLGLAHFWSGRSRMKNYENDRQYLGADKEWLAQYARDMLRQRPVDFFIFGHRHLPMVLPLDNGASTYVNLGDWIGWFTYAVLDGPELRLMQRMGDGPLDQDRRLRGEPPFTS